jgi:hypothetical protein
MHLEVRIQNLNVRQRACVLFAVLQYLGTEALVAAVGELLWVS